MNKLMEAVFILDRSGSQIRELISRQEEAGWEFMFIGADIDVFASADGIGIRRSRAMGMSKAEDSFTGCFDAVGDVMYCVASEPDRLKNEDWDALSRIFNTKKKRK